MDKTALLVIDAQQEYFCLPIGKLVTPRRPRSPLERIADLLAWARKAGVRWSTWCTRPPAEPDRRSRPAARRSRSIRPPAWRPAEPVVTKAPAGLLHDYRASRSISAGTGSRQIIVSGFSGPRCAATPRPAKPPIEGSRCLMAADAMAAMPVKARTAWSSRTTRCTDTWEAEPASSRP